MDAVTRRSAIWAGGAAAAGAAMPRSAEAGGTLDLADPAQRARARAKVIGSAGAETTYSLQRLHIYGYMNDGNLMPFFTMNNLTVLTWAPLANGNYGAKGAEAGVYCRFDTHEPLDAWENPITGETIPVWEFIAGPMEVEITPDGAKTGKESRLKPQSMLMEVIGDLVFIPSRFGSGAPNPFTPEAWPKGSSGKTYYWDTNAVYSAKVADVLDPKVTCAPAFCQFQNQVSFHPWLRMGGHAGRTSGHGYGTKVTRIADLPPAAVEGFRKKTPEIFDLASWKGPRRDFPEYMQSHKPG